MRSLQLSVVFLFLTLAAITAGATTILPVDAAQAVDQAELIFVGQAVAREVALTPGDRTPFTFVTFTVDQVLKGSVEGDEITLRFFGGEVDDEVIEAVGMPQFEELGKYLLFVEGNGRSMAPLVGWWQGKMDIVAHPITGLDMLVNHTGRPVLGVARDAWRASTDLKVDADGLFKAGQDDGVEVLWQDGVVIEDESLDVRQKGAMVPPASMVLDQVRALVSSRATMKSFRKGKDVKSAAVSDLPYNLTFDAVAPN